MSMKMSKSSKCGSENQFKIWETITCPSAELICIATQGWSSTFSYFEVRVGTAWVDKWHFVFYHL